MWRYDGTWHCFDSPALRIAVLERDPPTFELSVDVQVVASGQRYSATFFTPEQARECLARWETTGESLPGGLLAVPDLVLVGELSLNSIEAAVRFHLRDGAVERPLIPLDDEI